MAPNDDPLVSKSEIAIIIGIPCITNVRIPKIAIREDTLQLHSFCQN